MFDGCRVPLDNDESTAMKSSPLPSIFNTSYAFLKVSMSLTSGFPLFSSSSLSSCSSSTLALSCLSYSLASFCFALSNKTLPCLISHLTAPCLTPSPSSSLSCSRLCSLDTSAFCCNSVDDGLLNANVYLYLYLYVCKTMLMGFADVITVTFHPRLT